MDSFQSDKQVSPAMIQPARIKNSPQVEAMIEEPCLSKKQSQISVAESSCRERCAICFDNIAQQDFIKVLHCHHYYHAPCIDQWLFTEKRCPMCMTYLEV